MSQSKFLICEDYIKYNSYINLDDGNHIGIAWSCSNAIKAHNISYTPLKILTTGRSVDKRLTKYNCNNWREMMKEEKEPIDIEFSEQNADPKMMKMLLTLNYQM